MISSSTRSIHPNPNIPPRPPAGPSGGNIDGPSGPSTRDTVTISNEASQEQAAVDPARCGDNWRCVMELWKRGLLA